MRELSWRASVRQGHKLAMLPEFRKFHIEQYCDCSLDLTNSQSKHEHYISQESSQPVRWWFV